VSKTFKKKGLYTGCPTITKKEVLILATPQKDEKASSVEKEESKPRLHHRIKTAVKSKLSRKTKLERLNQKLAKQQQKVEETTKAIETSKQPAALPQEEATPNPQSISSTRGEPKLKTNINQRGNNMARQDMNRTDFLKKTAAAAAALTAAAASLSGMTGASGNSITGRVVSERGPILVEVAFKTGQVQLHEFITGGARLIASCEGAIWTFRREEGGEPLEVWVASGNLPESEKWLVIPGVKGQETCELFTDIALLVAFPDSQQ